MAVCAIASARHCALPESQAVIVELDRSAYNLSMEALTSPAGWYFGEKYPVVYSPGTRMEKSFTFLRQLGAEHSAPARRLPLPRCRLSARYGIAKKHNHPNLSANTLVNSSSTTWNEIRPRLHRVKYFTIWATADVMGAGHVWF